MSTYKYYMDDDEDLPLQTVPLFSGVDYNVKKSSAPTELDILKKELEAVKLELEIMKFTSMDF